MADIVISGNTSGAVTLRAPDVSGTTLLTLPTTSGTIVTTAGATSLTTSGNLTFTGTGNRITGDFSNATSANRVLFQSSTTNGITVVSALPNGTATDARFTVFNNSDPTNANGIQILANATEARLQATNFGTASAFPLTMYTGGSERLRIDTSGNVGIGTSSPVSISGYTIQTLNNGTSGSGTYYQQAATSIGRVLVTSTEMYVGTNGAYPLLFQTNATERMRITSGGNVGIGLSSPTYILQVAPGTYSDQLAVFNEAGTWTSNGGIVIADYYDNTTLIGGIKISASTATSGFLSFHTGGTTERMRITTGGNLLVGTTTGSFHVLQSTQSGNYATGIYNQSGTSPYALLLSLPSVTGGAGGGFLTCADNTNRLLIAGNGNVTNVNGGYGTISDQKLKENIVDATPKLEKVNQLKVRNYNLIGDDLKQIGFVAQEFEQIFPSMVEETADRDKDGNDLGTTTKSIKTSVLIPILVKAIQELNAKVEAQAAEIQALKGAK